MGIAMKMARGFHVATADEIKKAKTTDVYFVRTQEILKAKGLSRRRGYAEFTTGALPHAWPWGVFCGLEELLHLMEGIPVDIHALPEGTLFPALDRKGVRVPVMAVEGPYESFCLYETPMLGLICQATGVATKAARIREAAGEAQILAFGVRRMHPSIAPMLDRASYMGGCDGVSSLLGAQLIGEDPKGTMPHALMVVFQDRKAAWKAFDEILPVSVPRIALVDTYSDEKEEALMAAEVLGKRLQAIRLDTPASRRGDLAQIVSEIRWELDLRGYAQVRIIVSGGIDEESIPPLAAAGVSGFGVGTAISNAPTVDFAMDIVEIDGKPCAKRGKFSGAKVPWRCPKCLGYEVTVPQSAAPLCSDCKHGMERMFRHLLKRGRPAGKLPQAHAIRRQVLDQLRRVHNG